MNPRLINYSDMTLTYIQDESPLGSGYHGPHSASWKETDVCQGCLCHDGLVWIGNHHPKTLDVCRKVRSSHTESPLHPTDSCSFSCV